jgi:hypothetical protein
MMLTQEAAKALLKLIQADAKAKIKEGGGDSWTRIGASEDGMTLVIKVYCLDEKQTKITDFSEEKES